MADASVPPTIGVATRGDPAGEISKAELSRGIITRLRE
jgi:hypothetical protein